MAKGEVNRNLLFGLLALQNGLVDQSDLVAAFRDWVRDKNQSLAAYLIDAANSNKTASRRSMHSSHFMKKTSVRTSRRGVVATLGRHDRVRTELERSLDPDARSLVSFLTTIPFPAGDHAPAAPSTRATHTNSQAGGGRTVRWTIPHSAVPRRGSRRA